MAAKFTWCQESTIDLIELYKKHPVLYVTRDGNYKNRIKRLEALRAIKHEMIRRRGHRLTIEDIKKKIHGLRTQYSQQLAKIRKSKLSNGCEAYQPTLWCFSELDFLRHTQSIRSVVRDLKVPTSSQKLEDVSDFRDSEASGVPEPSQDTPHQMGYFQDDITMIKHEVSPYSSPAETPVFIPTSTSSSLMANERIEDDLSTFGKLVELELRKINNPQSLRKAKREILNILMDAQECCDN